MIVCNIISAATGKGKKKVSQEKPSPWGEGAEHSEADEGECGFTASVTTWWLSN
jgi:hypothetical protein